MPTFIAPAVELKFLSRSIRARVEKPDMSGFFIYDEELIPL
jgi:hypothetical protein